MEFVWSLYCAFAWRPKDMNRYTLGNPKRPLLLDRLRRFHCAFHSAYPCALRYREPLAVQISFLPICHWHRGLTKTRAMRALKYPSSLIHPSTVNCNARLCRKVEWELILISKRLVFVLRVNKTKTSTNSIPSTQPSIAG